MSNMVVRTNVFALNAHRNMKNVGMDQARASNRLSSGFRINSAADDAAGLAISETMRAQIRGLDQASRNAQDGQAMLLTTEGGLEEIGNMLQRTRELLVQASNDTNTQGQRTMIEQELNQLSQEIASMQQRVEFNTNRVLAMGPAFDSEISFAIADIEADGTRVTDAFALVDGNRRAVAEAREMLATLDGTTRFDQLNSRQQALVERALAAVELDTVTGGVITNVDTNIPDNIAQVVLGAGADAVDISAARDVLQEATAVRVAILTALADFTTAVTDFGASGAGGSTQSGTFGALKTALEAVDAAQTAIDNWNSAGGGTIADLEALNAVHATKVAELIEAQEAHQAARDRIVAAHTALIDLGVNAQNTGDIPEIPDALTSDFSLYDFSAPNLPAAFKDLATTSNSVAYLATKTADVFNPGAAPNANNLAEIYATKASALEVKVLNLAAAQAASPTPLADSHTAVTEHATALAQYNEARNNLMAAIDRMTMPGATPTDTVTAIRGLLDDRDNDLGAATTQLNEVRAEMLRDAEVQFAAISDFARFVDEPSSGDFVAWYQVGANENQGIQFDFETVSRTVSAAAAVVNLSSILVSNPGSGGGIGRGIEVTPLIAQVQNSLDDINTVRANLGAVQNRMDFTMRSLDISSENLQDSESRVRNADIAREMMRFTMSNVLQQAAVSMLSQANQMPNNLLQLLR